MAGKTRPMRVQRIRKAYEQVADQLLAMITAGELSPGDRLPSEAELARDFGVSRTTVREALASWPRAASSTPARAWRAGTSSSIPASRG